MDPAGIIEADAVEEFGTQLMEAESADWSSHNANEKGKSWPVDEGAGCSNNNTARYCCIKNVFHLKSTTKSEGTDYEGSEHTSGQGHDSVDNDEVLLKGILGCNRIVEGGEVEHQEEGPYEGENVWNITNFDICDRPGFFG